MDSFHTVTGHRDTDSSTPSSEASNETRITTELINKNVTASSTAEFVCEYSLRTEQTQISWFHNSILIQLNKKEKYIISNNETKSTLSVNDVKTEDEGIYEVRIQNESYLTSSSARLAIVSGKVKPEFEINRKKP